ncbi:MAG TPA: class I SAM-dependent methyltransferase [Chthoniobacterales bacterium]
MKSPKDVLSRLRNRVEARLFPVHYKERHEIAYWKSRLATEAQLGNESYVQFYTSSFDLEPGFYAGKRILDIGCGPRGSLEWADMAAERVGLDPLVPSYLKIGADRHKMAYVAASSDAIPFATEHFDVVCAFNSLDHVAHLEKTVAEIKRVTRSGGLFLLITEVNHPPSATEPINLPWSITAAFADKFSLLEEKRYEIGNHDIYRQIAMDNRFDSGNQTDRPGILAAKFKKR